MTIHDWIGLRMGYKWVQVGAVWILMDAVGSEARGGGQENKTKRGTDGRAGHACYTMAGEISQKNMFGQT